MPSASAMISQPAAWTTGKDRIHDDTVYGLATAVSLVSIVLTAFVARYSSLVWITSLDPPDTTSAQHATESIAPEHM